MLGAALVPLTVCSVILAAVSSVFLRLRPAWLHLSVIGVKALLASLGAYLITQCCLGAFPGHHLETWATLALLIFSVASAVAGSIALIGPVGLGLGAALFVFVGIPFSGVSSAPEMLPKSADVIGQLLPPGAGQSLLRDTAYFDGHGPLSHLLVLIAWSLFGILADIAGHHSFVGFAARRHQAAVQKAKQNRQLADSSEARVAAADTTGPEFDTDPTRIPAHAPAHAAHAAGPGRYTPPYAGPAAPQPDVFTPLTSTPYTPPAANRYPTAVPNPYAAPAPAPAQSQGPAQGRMPTQNPDPAETQPMDGFTEPRF